MYFNNNSHRTNNNFQYRHHHQYDASPLHLRLQPPLHPTPTTLPLHSTLLPTITHSTPHGVIYNRQIDSIAPEPLNIERPSSSNTNSSNTNTSSIGIPQNTYNNHHSQHYHLNNPANFSSYNRYDVSSSPPLLPPPSSSLTLPDTTTTLPSTSLLPTFNYEHHPENHSDISSFPKVIKNSFPSQRPTFSSHSPQPHSFPNMGQHRHQHSNNHNFQRQFQHSSQERYISNSPINSYRNPTTLSSYLDDQSPTFLSSAIGTKYQSTFSSRTHSTYQAGSPPKPISSSASFHPYRRPSMPLAHPPSSSVSSSLYSSSYLNHSTNHYSDHFGPGDSFVRESFGKSSDNSSQRPFAPPLSAGTNDFYFSYTRDMSDALHQPSFPLQHHSPSPQEEWTTVNNYSHSSRNAPSFISPSSPRSYTHNTIPGADHAHHDFRRIDGTNNKNYPFDTGVNSRVRDSSNLLPLPVIHNTHEEPPSFYTSNSSFSRHELSPDNLYMKKVNQYFDDFSFSKLSSFEAELPFSYSRDNSKYTNHHLVYNHDNNKVISLRGPLYSEYDHERNRHSHKHMKEDQSSLNHTNSTSSNILPRPITINSDTNGSLRSFSPPLVNAHRDVDEVNFSRKFRIEDSTDSNKPDPSAPSISSIVPSSNKEDILSSKGSVAGSNSSKPVTSSVKTKESNLNNNKRTTAPPPNRPRSAPVNPRKPISSASLLKNRESSLDPTEDLLTQRRTTRRALRSNNMLRIATDLGKAKRENVREYNEVMSASIPNLESSDDYRKMMIAKYFSYTTLESYVDDADPSDFGIDEWHPKEVEAAVHAVRYFGKDFWLMSTQYLVHAARFLNQTPRTTSEAVQYYYLNRPEFKKHTKVSRSERMARKKRREKFYSSHGLDEDEDKKSVESVYNDVEKNNEHSEQTTAEEKEIKNDVKEEK